MKIKRLMTGIMAAILIAIPAMGVYASDGEEYVTITVQASDDNEGITYALDSDDPGSFGPSNMFTVPAGTSHTIYVKDAAGNITSQVYEAPGPEPEIQEPVQSGSETAGEGNNGVDEGSGSSGAGTSDYTYSSSGSYSDDTSDGHGGQTIDIDLELKKTGSESERPYEIKKDTPAEQGEGTVYSKTFLDGTDSSEQVFYSMTTEEGNVFYLLIDQGQESNNVYLLNQVNNQDLAALAVDGGSSGTPENSGDDSLLKALSSGSGNDGNSADTSRPAEKEKRGINRNAVIVLLLMAAGGGFYYYQKVYKAKKEQEMDAMEAADMDQFMAEGEAAEDEEVDFKYGDGDKEQYIKKLIKEEEEEYAAAAESEAADMGWDVENQEPDSEEDIQEEDISGGSDGVDIFDDTRLDGEYDPDLDGEEEEE